MKAGTDSRGVRERLARARPWATLGIFLGLLAMASAAHSQQAPDQSLYGQTVAAVAFEIEGRPVTLPALTSLVAVKVGEPLTAEQVRASIDRLATVGQYEDVRTVATARPDGVDVTFYLIPRHQIDRLEVVGDETGLPAAELRRQLLQRYGGVPATVRSELIESRAAEILRDEGYLGATVTATTVPRHDPEGATLVLTASAGRLTTITATEVLGRSPLSAETVIARTGSRPGVAYKRRALDAALATLRDELSRQGYYEALATHRAEPTPAGAAVAITIEAGPRFELRVEPTDALPGDEDDLIPIRRVGSADRDLLEDSKARIEAALRDEGYWRGTASFAEPERSPTLVVIAFTIVRGPRYFVDRVDLPDGLAIPQVRMTELLDVRAGDVFQQAAFEAGLVRVLGEYRRLGYYLAASEPAYEEAPSRGRPNQAWVVLHPTLKEGPQGRVTRVTFSFQGEHQTTEAELRQRMRSRDGLPYVDQDRLRDQADLLALYQDRGFLTAAVSIEPEFGSEGRDVALLVTVNEGPQVLVGEITITGNDNVPQGLIRERLALTEGTPLSPRALREAQERLHKAGMFQRVTIIPEPGFGGGTERRVIVQVFEAPRRTFALGGGLEGGTTPRSIAGGGVEDRIELSPRASLDIGRRYLFNRNTAASLFMRGSLRPTNAPGDPARDGRGLRFADYRVTGTFRELYAFSSETDLLVGVTTERAERTTFNVTRRAANAEALHRLTPRIALIGRYSLDFAELSNERILPEDQLLIDRIFPQVRLSILSAGLLFDRRNNPLSPSRGTLIAAEYEMALRPLGSEVGYLKSFFQASWFRGLDESARTVLALRAQVGLAHGFLRTVPRLDENGQPILGPDGQPVTDRVQDLPVSQRFFAGGGTSVRGFQLDRLGVPEILNPDGLSLGGNTLVVANAEIRRVVTTVFGRSLAVVGFLDGGNVFPRTTDLDLSRIRGAAGVGVRFDSPLGAIRLDFGFKLNRLVVNDRRESRWEYHLSIGEAF
jgi:outer membrane protein assembly factor BamA